ncbi:MAG: transferase, partial [Candidatus Saccharimonas sp.]
CRVLEEAGFNITSATRAITNPWLVENRFQPAGNAYEIRDGILVAVSQPATNTLLIAQRPI